MTHKQRYDILSTFDISRIQRELGETYKDLGEVFRAEGEAFNRLSDAEKAADLSDIAATLACPEEEL